MTKTAPERDEIAGIVDFLCGAAPDWQGRWFDEASRQERGSFWWRTYVRQIERIAAKDRAEALAAQGALLEKVAAVAADEAQEHMRFARAEDCIGECVKGMVMRLSPDATAALAEIRREAVEQEREYYDLLLQERADEIERLRAAPKVKPLEWDDVQADSVFGVYDFGRIGGIWTLRLDGHDIETGVSTNYRTAAGDAKAAAQADYERRILSALTQEGE
jgi:hypothetical protein